VGVRARAAAAEECGVERVSVCVCVGVCVCVRVRVLARALLPTHLCPYPHITHPSPFPRRFMAHCARDTHCCVLRVGDARGGCIPLAGDVG